VREDAGVFLRGSCGQRDDPRRGLYGIFAGISQGKVMLQVSSVGILLAIFGVGNMRESLQALCASRCQRALVAQPTLPWAL
jgi:hypothetical protein